jgi:hypothetical protein
MRRLKLPEPFPPKFHVAYDTRVGRHLKMLGDALRSFQ